MTAGHRLDRSGQPHGFGNRCGNQTQTADIAALYLAQSQRTLDDQGARAQPPDYSPDPTTPRSETLGRLRTPAGQSSALSLEHACPRWIGGGERVFDQGHAPKCKE